MRLDVAGNVAARDRRGLYRDRRFPARGGASPLAAAAAAAAAGLTLLIPAAAAKQGAEGSGRGDSHCVN